MIKAAFAFVFVLLFSQRAFAAVSDVSCAATSDTGCWTLDYNDQTTAYQTALSAYHTLGLAKTTLLSTTNGIDYNGLPQAYRQEIWDKFYEADQQNGVQAVPAPADMAPDVFSTAQPWNSGTDYTDAEARVTFAAKLAHVWWVHIEQKLPWDLDDISATDYKYLVRPQELFSTWNPGGSPAASSARHVDHSPKMAWDVAINALGGLPFSGTQLKAFWLLLKNEGTKYAHSTAQDPFHAVTLDQSRVDYLARSGCSHASRIMVQLARTLLMPSQHVQGWYLGTSHTSAFFYSINGFLSHGDDIYQADDFMPAESILLPLDWAQANLVQNDAGNKSKNYRQRTIRFMAPWFMPPRDAAFCSSGWDSIKNIYYGIDQTQEQHWHDLIKQEHINRTDCTGDPP